MKHKELLRRVVEISYKMRLSHVGSNLSALPIIADIYEQKKPDEKFVLSAGHAHLAHLVCLEEYVVGSDGIRFNPEELLAKYGVHCDRRAGCDVSTGSLGHGIGAAVGMALADRSKKVYCLTSDGEWAEGSVVEAIHVYEDLGLDNLKIYVNDNSFGAYRKTPPPIYDSMMDYDSNLSIVEADMKDYPHWLQTQEAHYKVMNKGEYKELMEVVS